MAEYDSLIRRWVDGCEFHHRCLRDIYFGNRRHFGGGGRLQPFATLAKAAIMGLFKR
jgi:hypothetical protein